MTEHSLYHEAILEQAKAAVGGGRLDEPSGRATVDNPLCGDRVTVEVATANGALTGLAHHVRGCVLCQAAASVLGGHAVGRSRADLRRAAEQFTEMIRAGGPVPEGWPELEIFDPVRANRSRHDCVLLPFEAMARALAETANGEDTGGHDPA